MSAVPEHNRIALGTDWQVARGRHAVTFLTCRMRGALPVGFFAGYSCGALVRSPLAGQEAEAFFNGIRLDLP